MDDLHRRYRLLHGADTEAARAELARIRASQKPVLAVSACLLGVRCRFDGDDKQNDDALSRIIAGRDVEILPLCPEVLANMGVPRPPIHFSEDFKRALTHDGRDVTDALAAGARRADLYAAEAGAAEALLKEKSPSCGTHRVHTISGLTDGKGRFAERLAARGLPVKSEEE